MNKPRCPDPERLALLVENRLGRLARARILRHAADCADCRRHLAISSLSPLDLWRARLEEQLASGRLAVCAGLILGIFVVWMLGSEGLPEPRRLSRTVTPVAYPEQLLVPEPAPSPVPARTSGRASLSTPPEPEPSSREIEPRSSEPDFVPVPAPRASDRASVGPPRRLDSVAEAPRLPPPETPRPVESDALGRLAILDPFGALAVEGAGGRQPVLGSRVMPIEARITAVGRASGFRLGDGLRIQLAPGSAVSVFQNLTQRCAGLSIFQGALLVEAAQPQSLYLKREAASGVLERMAGPVSVSAGVRSDSLSVVSLGGSALIWKRTGAAALDVVAGDTLSVEGSGGDGTSRKPKPSVARFVSWPEPSSLYYSSFEDGVQGMERPIVVQGASKEGVVTAAVAGGKGRRTIELTLPSSLQTLPNDAAVRLRVRTTAARILLGVGGNGSRSIPLTVTQRNRSETVWTTFTVSLSALDQEGHHGRSGGSPKGLRGNLTLIAEAPSRVTAEELVFDLDEIEISRS